MDTLPADRRTSARRFTARLWRTMQEWHFEAARARQAGMFAELPRRAQSGLRAMYVHEHTGDMRPAAAVEPLQFAAPSPMVRPWTRAPVSIAPRKT